MAMNPTYYGPAQQLSSASDYQTAGSLNCAVQLDSKMTLRYDGPELVEKFKCKTRAVLTTGGRGFNIFGAKFQPDNARPDISGNASFVSRFPVPTTDPGWSWWVKEVLVEQQQAGDHSIVTVRSSVKDTSQGSQTAGGGWISIEGDKWDLEWRPYDMSVLAYCKNENKPPKWVRYLPNVNSDVLKSEEAPSQFSNGRYIKECANGSKFNAKWGQIGAWQWVRNQSVYELNEPEKKIFNYYVNGINPTLHYPVLTHTTTVNYERNLSAQWITIDGKVKHINCEGAVGKIDECVAAGYLSAAFCPYTFLDEWKWLKTGETIREVNEQNQTSYVRTEEFTGAKKWSGDFYKGGTWSINGQVPQNPWEIGEQ